MKLVLRILPVIFSVVLFLLGESWIISITALLGFIKALILVSILLTILSSGIVFFSENSLDKLKIAQSVKQWIAKKETSINPTYLRIYKVSKLLAILIVTLIAGPMILSVFTGLLNFQTSTKYLIAIVCSIIFSIFWVSLYNGVISFF